MKLRVPVVCALLLILSAIPTAAFCNDNRVFDSFGAINCEVEMARLDNLTIELQNAPDARAYIFIYGGKRGTYRDEVRVRGARMKRYLIENRGIDPARLVLVDGGYRESLTVEIWIVPSDNPAPAASATVDVKAVRFKKGKMARYSEIGCFPGKYLNVKFQHSQTPIN